MRSSYTWYGIALVIVCPRRLSYSSYDIAMIIISYHSLLLSSVRPTISDTDISSFHVSKAFRIAFLDLLLPLLPFNLPVLTASLYPVNWE